MNSDEMNVAITHGLFDADSEVGLHLSSGMSANGTVKHLVRNTDGAVGVVLDVTVYPEDSDPTPHSLFVPKSSIIAVDTINRPAE